MDIMLFDDTADAPQRLTLAAFFAANADGLGADERAKIEQALATKDAYLGGGGAAGRFGLMPALNDPMTATPDELTTAVKEATHDLALEYVMGLWCFHGGPNRVWVERNLGQEGVYGWEDAGRRCYALGVMDAAVDNNDRYPQFSAAWETWGDGWNEADQVEKVFAQRFNDNPVTTYPEAPFWLILIFEDEEWKQADTAHTEQQARELRDAYRASHGVAEAVRAFGVLA